jgi:hypothetical protein
MRKHITHSLFLSLSVFFCFFPRHMAAFAFAKKQSDPQVFQPEFCLPGLAITVALISINLVDMSKLAEDQVGFAGENLTGRARCCLFTSIIIAFSGLFGAIWILVQTYAKFVACRT